MNFIYILNLTHKIILYFMLFGFILPQKYIWIHAITWPIVYTHWLTNDGNCVLTEYEYKLKGKEIGKNNNLHEYPFMRQTFSEVGVNLTDEQIDKYVIKYITIVWVISVIRFYLYAKCRI